MIVGSWMYIPNVELIQVSGKPIFLRDEVCDQMCWWLNIVFYIADVDLCCTWSYCFKVYDQWGSHILKQLRFIWGSEFRKLVSWLMHLSLLSNTRQGQCSAVVNAGFFHRCICIWVQWSIFCRALTPSNPIFLPTTYSPALICFGQERGWWITCNYPTVLKEKNI
jgi:hypothetical protein